MKELFILFKINYNKIIESWVNMKNIEKYIMWVLIFIAIGAIGAAVYFGISADKDSSKKEENKQEVLDDESKGNDGETNEQTPGEDNEKENIDSEDNQQNSVVYYKYDNFTVPEAELIRDWNYDYDNWHKVYKTKTGTIIAGSELLDKTVVLEDVKKHFEVYASQSDICFGNSWLLFTQNNGDLKAMSIDSLGCGNEVKVKDLSFIVKENNLENIIEIYDVENKDVGPTEPYYYSVFVKDENGKTVEITDELY